MERRNNLAIVAAALALAAILLLASPYFNSNRHELLTDNNGRDHRNLRFSFFNDPRSVVVKGDSSSSIAVTDDAENTNSENELNQFHGLTHPSQNINTPPLNFHLDPNPPSSLACDGIVLFLPDGFKDHGIGSQLGSYIMAALTATYLDRALVISGDYEFLGGCPEEMIIRDDITAKAKNFKGIHFNELRSTYPKSLMRLVDHPEWLHRQCAMPCTASKNGEDWNAALKEASDDRVDAPDVRCENDENTNGGRDQVVMVANGSKTMHTVQNTMERLWVDRSGEEALVKAYNWALRLGGDVDEASVFASLRDREEILDYALGLASRMGILRFQPWIVKDVNEYISKIDEGIEDEAKGSIQPLIATGEYAGMHIRRGDKLDHESRTFVNDYYKRHPVDEEKGEVREKYIPLKHYLSQFVQIPLAIKGSDTTEVNEGEGCGMRHVYIATDDPATIHKEIDALPKDSETGLSKLTEDDTCLKFAFSFGPPLPGNSYHNVSYRSGLCTNLYSSFIASIADLTMLVRSATFVGEYNSNWGRLIRIFRLVINDVDRVRAGEVPPVEERDIREAWGNHDAKYIFSHDWKKLPPEEKQVAVADLKGVTTGRKLLEVVTGGDQQKMEDDSNHRRLTLVDPKSVTLKSDQPTNFFIDIATFTEGFSGWKVTLQQILGVVEKIPNASLVEPCMMNGRLKSCTTPYPEELSGSSYGPIPISEMFDLEYALTPKEDGQPPVMTLYSDFLKRTQQPEDKKPVTRIHLCLKASQKECPKPFVPRLTGPMKASAQNPDEITVYTVFMCWWGRCGLELHKNFIGGGSRTMSLPRSPLDIHPSLINIVKEVLANANIGEQYSLIHWRGERKQMDYIKCANVVVKAKARMEYLMQQQPNNPAGNHPFLLMTSLNEDTAKQWNGDLIADIASNGSPTEALAILEKNDFIRFDKLLQNANIEVKDPGMLGLYELILTTLANSFSTCSLGAPEIAGSKGRGMPPGCSQDQFSICHECNYMGKFARLALDMRVEMGGESVTPANTMGCWPV